MEKTLVIIKPSGVQRNLIGEIIQRFEHKGLRLCALKMMQLSDDLLADHYAHLKGKPFFSRIVQSMQASPVIVSCWEGLDAISVVRTMTGVTNGRLATVGTIRGDYAMGSGENIVHTSDSAESAKIELERFFEPNEFFEYKQSNLNFLYANDEL